MNDIKRIFSMSIFIAKIISRKNTFDDCDLWIKTIKNNHINLDWFHLNEKKSLENQDTEKKRVENYKPHFGVQLFCVHENWLKWKLHTLIVIPISSVTTKFIPSNAFYQR